MPKHHPYIKSSRVARDPLQHIQVKFHEPQVIDLYTAEAQEPHELGKLRKLMSRKFYGFSQINLLGISQHWREMRSRTIPKLSYVFSHPTYLDRFLGDLREKEVQRFEFERLWSERGEKNTPDWAESSQQVLYLWYHASDRSLDSISFYASEDTSRGRGNLSPTYEFRVQWFEPPVEYRNSKRSVQLRLKSPGSGSNIDPDTQTWRRRLSCGFHWPSLSNDGSPALQHSSLATLPTPVPSGSVVQSSSPNSPASPIGQNMSPEELAQSEMAQQFGSLKIQFMSDGGKSRRI